MLFLRNHRSIRHEQGMAMIYVLVLTPLLATIATGIIMGVAADGGIRQLQSAKAMAVAEAGLHHALAMLQGAGAPTYSGETLSIATDGGQTLGSATVTVSCLDGVPLPCGGLYGNYRRVIAQGQLGAGGTQRILTVTVEATAGTGIAVCAGTSLTVSQGTDKNNPTRLYSDVASNGTINLQGTGNVASEIRADPPAGPYANLGYYTGSAKAKGAITCDGSCNQHVAGTVSANQGTNVCPTVGLPTFSPGATKVDVPQSTSYTLNPAIAYDEIKVANGTTGGGFGIQSACSSFTTLIIPAGAAGTTTVIHAKKIHLDTCSRLMVTGAGRVELRLAETSAEALEGQLHARIGVTAADTPAVPAPLPAGQLKIITPSTMQGQGSSALDFDGSALVSAVLMAPNGGITYEPTGAANSKWYGAMAAQDIRIGSGVVFTYDPSVSPTMGWAGTNFSKLRTWKDQ